MGYDLKRISNVTLERPPRVVLIGEEKVGKTTFASQFPGPVLLPILGEEGADHIEIPKFPAIPSLTTMLEALEALATEEHGFKTLIIDSISALEPLIYAAICERDKKQNIEEYGYGKGYILAEIEWRNILDALDFIRNEKNMGIVMIGHSRVKTFSDPAGESYDRYELDVHKGASADILRWADSILFARWKTLAKRVDKGFGAKEAKAVQSQRILCTQSSGAYPAGGRGLYGHLPAELPLEYSAFESATKEAK
jgi:hypothetical protein